VMLGSRRRKGEGVQEGEELEGGGIVDRGNTADCEVVGKEC
jgi:hypothetical protein